MKTRQGIAASLLSGLLLLAMGYRAQAVSAESFSAATRLSVEAADASSSQAQSGGLYADGTRAINEGRWNDAVAIFTKIANENSEHADGALYWKAYAENKQGQSDEALNTCRELRRDHPKSQWVEECGALEIEIRAKHGQALPPQSEQNDDLKLLALNSLMKRDELVALTKIQQILGSDASETYKERALFILTQGQSKQAQRLLEQIAQGSSNPTLQAKAAEVLAKRHGRPTDSSAVATEHAERTITLDVVVTDKSGKPVTGLQAQDFVLLDNKQPQNILSFHPVDAATVRGGPPAEVILVVDGINSSFNSVANIRTELTKYLRQNGAHLALPTSFVFLSDTGTEIEEEPTRDGNGLLADLDQHVTGLRLFRGAGLPSAEERGDLSLASLDRIALRVDQRPGRKIVIWIGPGWPAFSGGMFFWVLKKDQLQLFDYVAGVSTALRDGQITIYSIDPEGVGHDEFYYLNFIKGVTTAKKAGYGDLMLQVLAYQSGGQVLFGRNDIAKAIKQCAADGETYYELTYTAPPAEHVNEYRAIEVRVYKPGLKIRTRTGYYAQP